jgi:hypothetical protein
MPAAMRQLSQAASVRWDSESLRVVEVTDGQMWLPVSSQTERRHHPLSHPCLLVVSSKNASDLPAVNRSSYDRHTDYLA